jgi:hypothetical protein
MTNRPYPYYPAYDGGKETPGIRKLIDLMSRRYGCTSLGTYVVRNMRNSSQRPQLSVHATGAALDAQYKDEKQARAIWDWLLGSSIIDGKTVEHSQRLGLVELHWYAYGDYGAGYRCSRGEGKAGVKIFTATDNAGSYQGSPRWFHIELSKEMAADAAKFETAWRSLPKP